MSNSTPSNRKLTTEEFIKNARKRHGNRYSYEKTIYNGAKSKVIINCKTHGYFEQQATNHTSGSGCSRCKIIVIDNETFIQQAIKIHGYLYDYSLVNYEKSFKKVAIICKNHGEFYQQPNNHLSGNGCPNCAHKIKNTETFIARAILTHGNRYDYSLVEYKNNTAKVKIICKEHGVFEQGANNHFTWNGCLGCRDKQRRQQGFTQAEILDQFTESHGDTYDYSLVKYTGVDNPVIIICKHHGEFSQSPYHHRVKTAGCPTCTKTTPYSRSRYVKACESNGGKSSLYLIRIYDKDEVFYKVGITKTKLSTRFSSIPYNYEAIFSISDSAGIVWDLERRLHKLLSKYHYRPLKSFGGSSLECFSRIPKDIMTLLKNMQSSRQLQLIA